MSPIQAVTVYCSASRELPEIYTRPAFELGRAIASAGWQLIYGGNPVGLMAEVANGARSVRGKVIGITPWMMADQGLADHDSDELIVTGSMRERKALLEQRGDAFIALPGGLGTLEELFEMLVGRVLGYHNKPIVLLNVADYYNPLLAMIQHGIDQRFIKPRALEAFFVAQTVREAIVQLSWNPNPPAPDANLRREEPSAME